jgi:ubiquinone biosynthesis protein
MDLVRTSIGIGKTIRNVARLREILRILAMNGFDEFIIRTGLHHKIPGFVLPKARLEQAISELDGEVDIWHAVAYRLRKSFEQLGPSFIKFGQLLSTREDLFPASFIKELKLLQNKVNSISFQTALKIIENELKTSVDDVFEKIIETPIGTASIGVAYKAYLKDQTPVVIKVKKPNIDQLIKTDFEILNFIILQVEKVSSEIKYLGLSRALKDFEQSIQLELNFNIEAQNCRRLSQNLASIDKETILKVPKIYDIYSSESILVMEYFAGKPFNELNKNEITAELTVKLDKSVHLFLHTMLVDGFFHADLHGGNFFLLNDGNIGIIDFGLMGTLSSRNRTNLVAILYALVTQNYENLVYEFLDVAEYESIPDEDLLIKDVKACLVPFMGLSIQQTNVTELVAAIVQTLSRHQLYLPREWFIIFRALMTLDGVGKSLGMDLNIFEVIDSDLKSVMDEVLSPEALKNEMIWIGRDFLNSAKTFPRHIRWFIKDLAKDKYQFKLNIGQLDQINNSIIVSFYFLGMMILSSIFIWAGLYLLPSQIVISLDNIPNLSWFFWMLALVMFVKANSIIKNKIK